MTKEEARNLAMIGTKDGYIKIKMTEREVENLARCVEWDEQEQKWMPKQYDDRHVEFLRRYDAAMELVRALLVLALENVASEGMRKLEVLRERYEGLRDSE